MLTLIEICGFLKSKINVNGVIAAGRIDQSSDFSIGVYDDNRGKTTRRAIGGPQNTKFYKLTVTILIHKRGGQNEALSKAQEVYKALNGLTDFYIAENHIAFVCPYIPQCVGYTSNGDYEYTVEAEFYVNKEEI